MAAEYAQSDQFRGARIHLCDLAGLEIRDCEVSGLKIVDCYGSDVYLGGDFERLVVNDVDVTAYVEAELDRQHPARVLARDATSPARLPGRLGCHRDAVGGDTRPRQAVARGHSCTSEVNGEWSLVETQRHLLFAGDAWLGNAVLEEEAPYHPLGSPCRRDAARRRGEARAHPRSDTPTLDEVLAPRLARMATMRRVVDGLTEAELDRVCGRKAGGPVSRPGVRRTPLPQGGAEGRGRAPPLCGARPRRTRGRCLT